MRVGDCCGVLPAAFHLFPFPNTFILRSVTRAKAFWFLAGPSVGSDPPNGDFSRWIAAPLYCQRMSFASRRTSIWRSYIIMQMVAMSHWRSWFALLSAQAAPPRLSVRLRARGSTNREAGSKNPNNAVPTHHAIISVSFHSEDSLGCFLPHRHQTQQLPRPFSRCHSPG